MRPADNLPHRYRLTEHRPRRMRTNDRFTLQNVGRPNLYTGAKPRTYRRNARKDYLNISKKKNKSHKNIRKAIGKQINYVKRDIKTIESLLDLLGAQSTRWPLTKRDQRIYWVLQNIYGQQK